MDSTKKGDALGQYRIEMMRQALEASGVDYTFSIYEDLMNQARRMSYLDEGKRFNVAIQGTSKTFEERFLPVRVPIYLGLGSGYRLILMRSELQAELNGVRNLKMLQQYSIGQGTAWSDIDIWRNAGFNVIESSYKNLFGMAAKGRFDLYSRGLFEAYEEHRIFSQQFPNLAVDKALLVYYPFAIYIFVSPKYPEIHQALTEGMQALYRTGKLQTLLEANSAVATALAQANLQQRQRIDLPAYNMTPESEAAIRHYVFKLQ
ncbi:transporter substrate-binding domain-containing protein [Maricurvus nonylphenolicus]|uniref:hypothetical protein n=1 Tax=Maricurvus nonylphenolicus TaxID=1008307 RepID=UPI0036F350FB